MDDRTEFGTVLRATWGAFTNAQPLTPATVEIYWIGLQDLEPATFRQAAMRSVKECRFFPTVAELRSLATQSREERAVLAWGVILREQAKGLFTTRLLFVFDDPAITAAIANLGGPSRIADLAGEQFHNWFRQEFERVYQVMAAQAIDPQLIFPLVGSRRPDLRIDQRDERVAVVKTGLPWALTRDQVSLPEQQSFLPSVSFQRP